MIGEKKSMNFPPWVEAALVVAMGVMAVVEAGNGSWMWAIIFGVGFLAFGGAALARAFSGEKHGKP